MEKMHTNISAICEQKAEESTFMKLVVWVTL